MRTLAWICGGFSGAILLSQLLPSSVSGWLFCVLPCVLLLLAVFLPRGLSARLIAFSVSFALGLAFNAAACISAKHQTEPWITDEYIIAEIRLDRFPVVSGDRSRADGHIEGTGTRVALYGDRSLLSLCPGQVLSGELRFYDAATRNGEKRTQYTSQGIHLVGYLRSGRDYSVSAPAGSVLYLPQYARQRILQIIDAELSGDSAALLKALLTGDRSSLSVSASTALQEAGVSHMIAISGMHLGFLLTMLTLLLRSRRRLVLFAAVPVLLFYVLLTGSQPSAERAMIMLLLPLIAFQFEREADGITTMLLALSLILIGNPFAAASAGAQLSFASVAGLMLITPRIYDALTKGKHPNLPLCVLLTSLSASAGVLITTTPLTLLHFRSFALTAPLGNLLCLWAAEGAFLSGLLAVVLGALLLPLGTAAAMLPGLLLRYILLATRGLSHIPFHRLSLSFPRFGLWLALAYTAVILAFVFRERLSPGRIGALAVGLALTLGFCMFFGTLPPDAALHTCVVDVGQGSCTILGQGSSYCMVDCGSGSGGTYAAGNAREALTAMRGMTIQALILTHYDADHINGLESLLELIDVEELILPDVEDDSGGRSTAERLAGVHGLRIRYLREKTPLVLGNALVYLYPPLTSGEDNEKGLALRVSYSGYDVLITGDMNIATEEALLAAYPMNEIECLVVGHHGSKYSTGERLLADITPEIACISVGVNRYGHPSDEVLDRLAAFGCEVHRTDEEGSVFLTSDPS